MSAIEFTKSFDIASIAASEDLESRDNLLTILIGYCFGFSGFVLR